MQRRHWLASFAAFVLSCGITTRRIHPGRIGQEEVSLTDRLQAGLKCRRPEEVEFVQSVVVLVDQQKLSKELVFSTFQWAVRQRPDFPFYYFKYGMKRRAAAEGVDIPVGPAPLVRIHRDRPLPAPSSLILLPELLHVSTRRPDHRQR